MDVTGNLNPEIQKILENVCNKHGWEISDATFAEILIEADWVDSEIVNSHRWYDEKSVVVKIEDRFIQYQYYHVTGDNSLSDMGLEFDLSSVVFCEEYQVTITKYRPIK